MFQNTDEILDDKKVPMELLRRNTSHVAVVSNTVFTLLTLDVLYHTMPHTPCRFEVNDVHSLMSYTTPCHTRRVGLR